MPANKTPTGKGNKTPKKTEAVAEQKEEAVKVEVAKTETPKAGKAKANKETPKATPAKKETPKATPAKKETPKATPAKKETPKATPAKNDAKETPKEAPKAATPKEAPKAATPKSTPAKKENPKAAAKKTVSEAQPMQVETSKKRSAPETTDSSKNQKTEADQTPSNKIKEAKKIVFLGNLLYDLKKAELKEILTTKNVHPVDLRMGEYNGKPRGFAHLEFASEEEASAAAEKLKGLVIRERDVRVEISRVILPGDRQPTKILYVGQLDDGTTEEALKEFFEKNGYKPESTRIMKKKNQEKSRGFGFAQFESAEIAEQAMKLNGEVLDGNPVKLDYTIEKRRPADNDTKKQEKVAA